MSREVMTPAEVAREFAVDPKTVTRWAASGRLSYFRTVGGHRRFYRDEVQDLLAETRQERRVAPGRRSHA